MKPSPLSLSLLVVLFLSGLVLSGQDGVESPLRITEGLRFAKEALSGGGSATLDAVLPRVRAYMRSRFPALKNDPSEPAITERDSLRGYSKKFEAILDARHPVLSEAELDRLAAQRYPLYRRGDHVKVYYVRGNTITSCSGRIGMIEDSRVLVGSRKIYFSDMEGIEGNDLELLKFRPEENALRRAAYKVTLRKEIEAARNDFRMNKHRAVENEILAHDARINERNGYTKYHRDWLVPEVFYERLVSDALQSLEDARYAVLNRKMKSRREAVDLVEHLQDFRFGYEPPGTVENPGLAQVLEREAQVERDRLSALAERERVARAAAAKARADRLAAEQKRLAEEAAKRAAAAAKAAEQKRLAEEAAQKAREEEAAALEEERLAAEAEAERKRQAEEASKLANAAREAKLEAERRESVDRREKYTSIIVGIIAFVIVAGICLTLLVHHKRKNETDPFAKFFEGKGRLQKDFWSQATADPEHFKYVAYMFSNLEEATKALGHLSYMRPAPDGSMHCTRDLSYGVYPHLDGAVCFVGGVKFSYALWREASAVLPELPNAQYFKVSTEPSVQLLLPDLDKLSSDKHVHIESLGVEDGEGENGEFNRLYKYRSDSREEAMSFLDNFNIHEAGIIVHVETPDGILGKDENGVFTLEDNVLGQPDDGMSIQDGE